MLDQNMSIKQGRNMRRGKRKSVEKEGKGKFWEDRKPTLRTAALEQQDHSLKNRKQKTN